MFPVMMQIFAERQIQSFKISQLSLVEPILCNGTREAVVEKGYCINFDGVDRVVSLFAPLLLQVIVPMRSCYSSISKEYKYSGKEKLTGEQDREVIPIVVTQFELHPFLA